MEDRSTPPTEPFCEPDSYSSNTKFFHAFGTVVASQLELLNLQVTAEHWGHLRKLQALATAPCVSVSDCQLDVHYQIAPRPLQPGGDHCNMALPETPHLAVGQVPAGSYENHEPKEDRATKNAAPKQGQHQFSDESLPAVGVSDGHAPDEEDHGNINNSDVPEEGTENCRPNDSPVARDLLRTRSSVLDLNSRLKNLNALQEFAGDALQGVRRVEDALDGFRMLSVIRYATQHAYFSFFITSTILANALVIAIQTEWRANNVGTAEPIIFEVLNMTCNAIFVLELGLKLASEGRGFFRSGKGFRWKMFDIIIVAVAIIETILGFVADGASIPGGTLLRVLRMLRIVRSLRALHTAMIFRELRLMIYGMLNSILALTWLILLLTSVMLLFSIFITHIVTDMKEAEFEAGLGSTQDVLYLQEHFGTIARSLYSLYKSYTSGDSWGYYCDVFNRTSPILGMGMMIYIAFVNFALLNVATGVFVEFATKAADDDVDSVALEKTREHKKMIEEFCKVFRCGDEDHSGELTLVEFKHHIVDPRVQAYFKFIDLDFEAYGADEIFELLDFDGGGTIDLSEFVDGLSRLRGRAKSLDVALLQHNVNRLDSRIASVLEQGCGTQQRLEALLSHQSTRPPPPQSIYF